MSAAALVLSAGVAPAQPAPTFSVAWQQMHGRAGVFTEFRALAPGRDGVVVGASERTALEQGTSPARLLVWRLDTEGRLQREIVLVPPAGSAATSTATIRDLHVLASGDILVLAEFEGGRPVLVRIGAEGATTSPLVTGDRRVTLMRMLVVDDDRVIVFGHERLDAVAIAVDGTGRLLWERKSDRGRMEFFVDAVAAADGSLVLVGNSGTYDALRAGPSTIWLARYEKDGTLRAEESLPGRYGSLVRARDGFALAYDRGDGQDQRIRLATLSRELKVTADVSLFDTEASFSDFRAIAVADRGLLVAGNHGGRLALVVVDAEGRPATPWRQFALERAVDVGNHGVVALADGALVVASSHIDAQTPGASRQRVRVQKVTR